MNFSFVTPGVDLREQQVRHRLHWLDDLVDRVEGVTQETVEYASHVEDHVLQHDLGRARVKSGAAAGGQASRRPVAGCSGWSR